MKCVYCGRRLERSKTVWVAPDAIPDHQWVCVHSPDHRHAPAGADEPLPPVERCRELLGKRVKAWNGLDPGEEHFIVGVLTAFTDDGEFDIRDDVYVMHYCWPLLKIEEAP